MPEEDSQENEDDVNYVLDESQSVFKGPVSLLRESTLVEAGHVSTRFLQIPEKMIEGRGRKVKLCLH